MFRDKFDPIKGQYGHGKKDSENVVIPMTAPSVRQYYNRLLFSIGIRSQKKRRHEFSVHGFRKYFKTRAEQSGMKPINVEILMGHSVGISDSYYRPTENELLQDYLRVTDALTLSQENQLRHAVEKLKVETAEINIMKKNYLDMKLSLEAKDERVAKMHESERQKDGRMKDLEAQVKILITSQTEMSKRLYEAGILKKD